jgi:hypothetical protein
MENMPARSFRARGLFSIREEGSHANAETIRGPW